MKLIVIVWLWLMGRISESGDQPYVVFARNGQGEVRAIDVDTSSDIGQLKQAIIGAFELPNYTQIRIPQLEANGDGALLCDLGVGAEATIVFDILPSTVTFNVRITNRCWPTRYWPSEFDYNFACDVTIGTDYFFDEFRQKIRSFVMSQQPHNSNINKLKIVLVWNLLSCFSI